MFNVHSCPAATVLGLTTGGRASVPFTGARLSAQTRVEGTSTLTAFCGAMVAVSGEPTHRRLVVGLFVGL